jgi:hypothetical protein
MVIIFLKNSEEKRTVFPSKDELHPPPRGKSIISFHSSSENCVPDLVSSKISEEFPFLLLLCLRITLPFYTQLICSHIRGMGFTRLLNRP